MKVTFLVVNYAPSIGGAQLHVQRLAEGLVARHGHHVEVLTTDAMLPPAGRDPGWIESREEIINGVHVHRRPVARRTHRVLRTFRRIGRRAGVVRSVRPTPLAVGPLGLQLARSAREAGRNSDAVIGVASPFLTLFGADRGTRGTGAAHLVMPLLHLSMGEPRPWAVRSMRRADGVTSSTEHERDWLVQHGVAPERMSVLPPGCDPDRYQDTDASTARGVLGLPDRPTVGYVGRLAAHKGVDTLLGAAERIWASHPDTTLLLAGNHAGWDAYERAVERLRPVAGDRLVLREGFDDRDKPDLLAACDVIAFPSRQESFGMVTIEAWCARRPVVAGDIDAVRCVIRPGVDGELVPVGDSVALADEVVALLDDPERRARYGEAGRRRAEAEFSWDDIIDRFDEFLGASVRRRRGLVVPTGPMASRERG